MADIRERIHNFLNMLMFADEKDLSELLARHITADCVWDVSHPINTLIGSDQILDKFVLPLRRALTHVRRRNEIFIGGRNRRAEQGDWVASVAHYVGNFSEKFVGIQPSEHLVFLRSGEFYQVSNNRIVQARIILDLPDLMRQTGALPFKFSLGLETLFPGPATHDGVLPRAEGGDDSLNLVEAMLSDLHVYDPNTLGSNGQTGSAGHWHEDMLWYGPAGVGSNYRWEGFIKDHRTAFLRAFPDRKGGNHYCRIGDGSYAAVSGWPSMTMTFQNDYLGIKANNNPLTLRVMDFYRTENNKIKENWVLLDYMDLMAQMGIDLIAGDAK